MCNSLLLQELARALPNDRTVERELAELAAEAMAQDGGTAIMHWAVMNCRCVALVHALLNTSADTEALFVHRAGSSSHGRRVLCAAAAGSRRQHSGSGEAHRQDCTPLCSHSW
jgi:hypothetical protein